MTEPFDIEILDLDEVNFISNGTKKTINRFNPEQDELLKVNLENPRLELKAIKNLCYIYRDIFYYDGGPLSFTNGTIYKINLSKDSPIFTKSYRFPEIHKNAPRSQISRMLEQGIIQPYTVPWSSPIWIVHKIFYIIEANKNGEL